MSSTHQPILELEQTQTPIHQPTQVLCKNYRNTLFWEEKCTRKFSCVEIEISRLSCVVLFADKFEGCSTGEYDARQFNVRGHQNQMLTTKKSFRVLSRSAGWSNWYEWERAVFMAVKTHCKFSPLQRPLTRNSSAVFESARPKFRSDSTLERVTRKRVNFTRNVRFENEFYTGIQSNRPR
jgi:hypothetical protein